MFKKQILLVAAALFTSCSAEPIREQSNRNETDVEGIAEKQMVEKPIMTWLDLTRRQRPEPTTTIRYSALPTGLVDVWIPEGEGPHPVVLMIHGGCWQKSIADRTLMNYAADELRKRGFAVWNIEYRGVDEPGGGYPGTFEDVVGAGNSLSQYASELNMDLTRVAGFGHSAGGHLITWYAGSKNLPEYTQIHSKRDIDLKGVVNSGGLADLVASEPVTLSSCLAEIRPRLTGPATSERRDPFDDTSSERLLPTGVTVYSVNGAKDKIAPNKLGVEFTRKALAAGDTAFSIAVEGEGHVELIAPGTKAFDKQAEILSQILGLE